MTVDHHQFIIDWYIAELKVLVAADDNLRALHTY
jgi:hypothetical protein